MPRAIAPEVTMTMSTPSRCSAATSSQTRAITASRSSPESSVITEEPSLTTAAGISSRSLERSAGIELEDDAADLDVVTGLEPGPLQRGDHAHPPQAVLDMRERLVVLEVVAGDQAVDRLAGHAELAVAGALDRERPPGGRAEHLEVGHLVLPRSLAGGV